MIWVETVIAIIVIVNIALFLWGQFYDIPGEW